jgi:hypothetical protein
MSELYGGILKLDESLFGAARCRACASRISNPKSEIADWTCGSDRSSRFGLVQFEISDFGFEMREAQARQRAAPNKDSSNFQIFPNFTREHADV